MDEIPSLYSLCVESIKKELLLCGNDVPPDIYELPADLFDSLMICLPPIALQKLQINMPVKTCDENELTNDCSRSKRKRKRYLDFNTLWRKFYMSRWPCLVRQNQAANWLARQVVEECETTNDWQQMYWEAHIQNCLDEVAEVALLPSFNGCIGEISIPDAILEFIGCEGHKNCSRCNYAKLSYHCQQFACYVRYLRLQNVICVAESCNLFKTTKLQRLELHRINSTEHVETLCKLLNKNKQTLTSLEFKGCKLSSYFLNAICDSLCGEGHQGHIIEYFSIKASHLLEMDWLNLPVGLSAFLSTGRSLTSLILSDNHLGQNFARMVFTTLLDAASGISILDLSENNIAGSLSRIGWRSSCCSLSSSGLWNSLQSLTVLNLRGNNLKKSDAVGLTSALVHMPNLEVLDISDNPIEDEGIKSLLPGFVEMSELHTHFKDLRVENCELSCYGVDQLLDVLSTMKHRLESLSLGANDLGCKAGSTLGKFLCTGIKALDIEDIGLGPSGFLKLQDEIREDLKLVDINMSKNRGGVEAARFLAKLVQRAPELVAVNGSYNFMPPESFAIICSALKVAKGKLEHVDLTGNTLGDQSDVASVLSKFGINGESIVILPPSTALSAPYDDDP